MRQFPSVYRALCLSVDGDRGVIKAKIPQVFGDITIDVTDSAGAKPFAGVLGWVSFENGQAEKPVWMGSNALMGQPEAGGGDVPEHTHSGSLERFYNYSTSVVMANPGAGAIRTNAAPGVSTSVAISFITDRDIDITPVLEQLTEGDVFSLQQSDNSNNWVRYVVNGTVTDNTTWFLIPVESVGAGGSEPNNGKEVMVTFTLGAGGGGGGGGGADEVVVSTTEPALPNQADIWYDPDAPAISAPGGAWIQITQAAYDALAVKDPATLYVIVG